ncbi:hypothetical protein VR46_39820, partial [Streptomyces sp. NRRL S-444]
MGSGLCWPGAAEEVATGGEGEQPCGLPLESGDVQEYCALLEVAVEVEQQAQRDDLHERHTGKVQVQGS